ncbi:hypothetical protein Si026_01278 [Streptococcus infantarius subsp. infantarius]|nr:hypothetical protein [Streptococcus infantarius subsp. infantarius]
MKTNGIPKIRFKGFTDDWEQRKLGELVTFSKGSGYSKGDLLKEGTPIILYGRLYTKYETVISNVDTFVEPKGKSVFSKGGEVIVPGSGETAEDISIASVVEESGVLLGGDLNIITPPKEINSAFLAISISNGKPHKDMAKMAQGKSVVHLHNSDLAKIDFPFPIYEEQCRISNQFAELDNLITLHQRKCEQTKELKKFMLQKMFPKKGEKNPEIRFPGFTDDWEQRKLGEVGTARSGVGFPDVEQGGVEGIPFFKVSDMNIEGNENELVIANNYVTTEQISRKKWNVINDVPAIFFAKVGAAVMLNRKRLVRFPFLLDNNTMAYVFNKNVWNCDFGKTLFETLDLTKLTQVGALPSYNASDVENIHINIPNKDEQQKIGEYFSNLDHLITLHQRKCEQLKELKKFMLQNMFPKKG